MPTATNPHLDTLTTAYAMTDADKARLSALLARAYLTAKAEAYQRAARTASRYVRVKHPWTPGKADASAAQVWADAQVESIAATYEGLLRHAIEAALDGEERAFGDMAGKVRQVAVAVSDWFKGFVGWKSEQVAGYTESAGENAGTLKWIDDASGDDAEWVDGISTNDGHVQVQVTPESSSSDFCSQYAGNVYSLDEIDDLPLFPAHVGCIHSLSIIAN